MFLLQSKTTHTRYWINHYFVFLPNAITLLLVFCTLSSPLTATVFYTYLSHTPISCSAASPRHGQLIFTQFILTQITFIMQILYDLWPASFPWGPIILFVIFPSCTHLCWFASIRVHRACCAVMCTSYSTYAALSVTIVHLCVCAQRGAIKRSLNIIFLPSLINLGSSFDILL